MCVCFFNFFIPALLRPQIAIGQSANISRVIIHIRIVLSNAKYLITWSNFVIFGNSRYQQNLEIIFYAFVWFLCRWQSNQSTSHHFTFHWCPLSMLHSNLLKSGSYCAIYSVIVQCNACTFHGLFVWSMICLNQIFTWIWLHQL